MSDKQRKKKKVVRIAVFTILILVGVFIIIIAKYSNQDIKKTAPVTQSLEKEQKKDIHIKCLNKESAYFMDENDYGIFLSELEREFASDLVNDKQVNIKILDEIEYLSSQSTRFYIQVEDKGRSIYQIIYFQTDKQSVFDINQDYSFTGEELERIGGIDYSSSDKEQGHE